MAASKRGLSYSDDEIRTLLDIVGKILPIGQEEWKAVETQHNIDWAQTGRCFQSLRKKFNSFANARMPTGDAYCPPHIVEAKRILEEIKKEAEIEMYGDEFEEPAEAIEGDMVSVTTTINEDPAGTVTPAASVANPDNIAIAPVIPAVPVPLGTLPGGAQASSTTVPAVSNAATRASRLQRMSTGRIRRGAASGTDDMSIQDFFKFTLLQREEDRKERMEREQIREKERQEEREKRDAEERMFRNLFLGILAQGKNGNTDTNTDTNSEI